MADDFSPKLNSLEAPARQAVAVTPNDSTDLAAGSRGLYVGTGGTIKAILVGDTAAVEFVNVPDGAFLPIRVIRVYATVDTGTVADDIVALY